MANYYYASMGGASGVTLSMTPINKGDANLYFRVEGDYTLVPGSKVKAIIVPSGIASLPDPSESYSVNGLLTRLRGDKVYYDTTYGIFSIPGGENNTDSDIKLSFNELKINDYWENKRFDLHWIVQLGSYESYGSISGIYSLPHNVQNSEIIISGNLTTSGLMQYNVKWNSIANEGDGSYGAAPTDGPYRLKVQYAWNSGVAVSGGLTTWTYYPSGTMLTGISFNIPYNDERTGYNTPAIYNFYLTNMRAGVNRSGSLDKVILIDHQKFTDSENYFKNLDDQVFTSPDPDKLKKVGTIAVDPGVINRRRLSIGVNDIAIKDNTYVKQGVYVSPYYPVDTNLYTLSLKTVESIPEYPNIDPYSVIQYFIEINSKWERISPINRGDEIFNGILVPKILVFDKGQTSNSQVKYIEISNVKIFRVKIVFDLTNIEESKFIPPEVSDFKCIIFDKDQLNEL